MFKVLSTDLSRQRFKIMSLDEEIEALVGELNRAFKAYVSQLKQQEGDY